MFDDREVSPGIKFADADLRGMPLRLTISERSLKRGGIEFSQRGAREREIIPMDAVVQRVESATQELFDDLARDVALAPTWEG